MRGKPSKAYPDAWNKNSAEGVDWFYRLMKRNREDETYYMLHPIPITKTANKKLGIRESIRAKLGMAGM